MSSVARSVHPLLSHTLALPSLILWEAGFVLDWVTTVIGVSFYGIGWEGNSLARILLQGWMLPWHLLHVLLTVGAPVGLILAHRRGYFEGRVLSLALLVFAVIGIILSEWESGTFLESRIPKHERTKNYYWPCLS